MTGSQYISYVNPAFWQNIDQEAAMSVARLYNLQKTGETKMNEKRFHCENCLYLCGMEEKLKYILDESSKLFTRFGVKSVSMDEVASQLGISKKTLYQYFSDKKDLVLSVMKAHMDGTNECFKELKNVEGNAIDILIKVSQILIERMGKMNPAVNYDLKKYYPEAFKAVMEYKRIHVLENIEKNLIQGIREGLYRKDMNTRVIAYFYLIRMDQLISLEPDDEKMKNMNTEAILNELFIYHIRGIANDKGIEYLETKVMKDIKQKKSK